MTIIEPSQNPNKTDADAAWEKETTNAINALQNQIQNLGSGVVSSNNRILVYATDAAGSDMSYEQKSLSGFSAVLSYAGDLPTLPISGLVFSPFSDTEVNTTIKQYIRTNTVQTSAPAAVGTYNTRTGEWSKSVGWQKTIPQADNVPTWVCHAVISGSGNVAINWTNPTLFYSNNRATGVVYYTEPQAATPSKPTATDFSFTTFVMTFGNMESGAANKWQQQPFSYDVTDTLKKQYTCEYIAEKHPGSNTATVTFSSPRGYVGIADDLESNNYQAGNAGWKIKRDNGFAEFGSAAIRGTLSIGQIPAAAQNSNISIASNGTLNGAGGGSVSASGIGAIVTGGAAADVNAGTTTISGSQITTGTMNANVIGAGFISADRLQGNSINANKITANSITTDRVIGQAFTSFAYLDTGLATGVGVSFTWTPPITGQVYQVVLLCNFITTGSTNSGAFTINKVETTGSGIQNWSRTVSLYGIIAAGNNTFLSHFGNASGFFNTITGGTTYTTTVTTTTNLGVADCDVLVLMRNR